MRLLLMSSLVFAACGATPATEAVPVSQNAVSTEPTGEPRHARAMRAGAVVELTDTPGLLVDGNAPPPPPGTLPAVHVVLTASCDGDPIGCSEAGTVVRASASFDAAIAGLRDIGFTIEETRRTDDVGDATDPNVPVED